MVKKKTTKGKTKKRSKKKINYETEIVLVEDLKPHPRNYRTHPKDQLEHIKKSIADHGYYRNIVIAKDGTILAGHGVLQAVKEMGIKELPAIRLKISPNSTKALQVLAGDNGIGHLGIIDDRGLTEILKDLKDGDELLGTGYDGQMLANLVYVTRPKSEIEDLDAAAEWVGMPDYVAGEIPIKVTISFRNEKDRMKFAEILGLEFTDKTRASWWPPKEQDDAAALLYEG